MNGDLSRLFPLSRFPLNFAYLLILPFFFLSPYFFLVFSSICVHKRQFFVKLSVTILQAVLLETDLKLIAIYVAVRDTIRDAILTCSRKPT